MDNSYNLDSIIFLLDPSYPLIICVNGVYYLCYWSMVYYDNERQNCIIEFTYKFWDVEDYSFSEDSIRLSCYWTIGDTTYDAEKKIFKKDELA